jgi:WD40 repeat protein
MALPISPLSPIPLHDVFIVFLMSCSCSLCSFPIPRYDIESRQRTNRSLGHSDDVNAVEWFDETSRLFASGSDDGLVNLWDVRLMGEEGGGKVGTLAGNRAGVTFLNAKGDGVHLLSQGKDQCVRLFDIRTMASGDLPPVEATFDYR